MKHSREFQAFDSLIKEVLAVPRAEILRREEEYKRQSLLNPERRGSKRKPKPDADPGPAEQLPSWTVLLAYYRLSGVPVCIRSQPLPPAVENLTKAAECGDGTFRFHPLPGAHAATGWPSAQWPQVGLAARV